MHSRPVLAICIAVHSPMQNESCRVTATLHMMQLDRSQLECIGSYHGQLPSVKVAKQVPK